MKIELSPKQCEFIQNATHRFNGKIGATQCGKTFIDIAFVIMDRIMERRGKPGLNLILGVTKESVERNVLAPMRDQWGERHISEINSRNICYIFEEKVYCIGAEKASQVSKLRGAKFKYAYIDEIVDINQEVFELLKSRLSLDYSVCDFAGNPSYPTHYVKKFIDSDADVYCQQWTLYDNPFISQRYIRALEVEYAGSVYYHRYILGQWQRAEGLIYQPFSDNPERYLINTVPALMEVNAGLDFGGTKSHHAVVATGITPRYGKLIALKSARLDANGTLPKDVEKFACDFVGDVIKKYGRCDYLYWDNEASVLGRGVKEAVEKRYPSVSVRPCFKGAINDRIALTTRLLGLDMFGYTEDCQTLKNALEAATWDDKHDDKRLDDGSTDIDTLDSFEYTFTRNMDRFIF